MPYSRLRFDPAAEGRIINLGRHLKAHTMDGAFYDQLDPRANLGCHDYHVTLVARLHMYSDIHVATALEAVAQEFRGRQFTVKIQRWEMRGSSGSLRLVVDVEGSIGELKQRIHRLLPQGNLFRPPCHITMGNFEGTAQQRQAFISKLNATTDPTLFGWQFQGVAIEFENDDARPNPPSVSLLAQFPPPAMAPALALAPAVPPHQGSGEATAIQRLNHANQACANLQPVCVRASVEASGFSKMEPVDPVALRAVLQPVHDDIKAAFTAAPEFTANWLQANCNPYSGQDLGAVVPRSGRWECKLGNLHASTLANPAFQQLVGQQGVMEPQAVPTGAASGWIRTLSPLMCYLSGSGLWVTVRLADLPGLVPGDECHWHFSLAKISRFPDEQQGLPGSGVGGGGGEVSVYVGNLSWDVNWQTLKDHFKSAGNVLRANVMVGNDGRSRGWGLVTYASALEAQNAISMLNGSHLNGRPVNVREDRGPRSGGKGGGYM